MEQYKEFLLNVCYFLSIVFSGIGIILLIKMFIQIIKRGG